MIATLLATCMILAKLCVMQLANVELACCSDRLHSSIKSTIHDIVITCNMHAWCSASSGWSMIYIATQLWVHLALMLAIIYSYNVYN